MPVPIEQVLQRLQQVRRVRDNTWMACCPAHDDQRPSLQIRLIDRHIMLHCFSGRCTFADIVAAMGYQQRDMFPDGDGTGGRVVTVSTRRPKANADHDQPPASPPADTWMEAADKLLRRWGGPHQTWEYHNSCGHLVGVVLRWNMPKGQKMIRPVALWPDGWHQGGMPRPRPLYRLPDLLAAGHCDPVVVAEGEKAADALVACGFNATTSAHGAQSADKTDWRILAGRPVVLVPDTDGAGRRYMASVGRILLRYGPLPLTVVRLPVDHGGDAHDLLESLGGDVDECRGMLWRLICRAGAKWARKHTNCDPKRATCGASQSG